MSEDKIDRVFIPRILKAMSLLSPRYQKVIELRFFSLLTLEEVAREMDVTRERIRQMEAKAIETIYDAVNQGDTVSDLYKYPPYLSANVQNALHRKNITSKETVMKLSPQEIMDIPGLGNKALEEIMSWKSKQSISPPPLTT